jgi:hypothetical protein
LFENEAGARGVIIEGPWGKERRKDRTRSPDRRGQHRAPGLFSGKIYYGSGFTLNCTVHNLSARGAKIRIEGHPGPDGFHLILVKSGLAMNAHTVWRGEADTGVRFLSAIDLNNPPAQHAVLRQIWMHLVPR